MTTPFTLASTDAAFEGLYSKILRCPGERPEFTDFDEEEDITGWTSTPNGTPTFDPDRKSDGAGSMRVCGSGFISLESPTVDPTDWMELSNQLAIDVYAPVVTPPPYWWGAIQLQIGVPAAGLYNAWSGRSSSPVPSRGATGPRSPSRCRRRSWRRSKATSRTPGSASI
jgi:hypothetical protein